MPSLAHESRADKSVADEGEVVPMNSQRIEPLMNETLLRMARGVANDDVRDVLAPPPLSSAASTRRLLWGIGGVTVVGAQLLAIGLATGAFSSPEFDDAGSPGGGEPLAEVAQPGIVEESSWLQRLLPAAVAAGRPASMAPATTRSVDDVRPASAVLLRPALERSASVRSSLERAGMSLPKFIREDDVGTDLAAVGPTAVPAPLHVTIMQDSGDVIKVHAQAADSQPIAMGAERVGDIVSGKIVLAQTQVDMALATRAADPIASVLNGFASSSVAAMAPMPRPRARPTNLKVAHVSPPVAIAVPAPVAIAVPAPAAIASGGARTNVPTPIQSRAGNASDWITRSSPDHLTLQLASLSNAEGERKFVRELRLGEKVVSLPLMKKGARRYVVFYGSFPDRAAAERAAKKLTRSHKVEPWIRSFGDVRRELPRGANGQRT
jgi:septal ring-binding cell division protein DamX